jgi:hypothetical protein
MRQVKEFAFVLVPFAVNSSTCNVGYGFLYAIRLGPYFLLATRLAYFQTQRTEAVCSSETSVNRYRSTLRYTQKSVLFIVATARTSNPIYFSFLST